MGKKKSVQKSKVPDSKSKRLNRFVPLMILSFAAVLTILAYIRSLNGPLVLDDSIIIDSQRLQHVLDSFQLRVRKVADISFAINYMISGMSIPWFRITNIALHILTAIVACYFTYLTLTMPSMKDRFGKSSPIISTAVAVLFMLHPIQTSTVNYITQRMALMAAMFSFSGVILYAKAAFNRGKKALLYYAFCAVSFVFALFSKENSVMVLLLKGDPNAKLVYFHLGMVYSKKGDKQLAKKNLQLFLSLAGSNETFTSYVEKAKEQLAHIKE